MSTKRLAIERPVWFFLVAVRVTGSTKQPWTAGSEAVIQTFVPGRKLEDSLTLLDAYLSTQELERIDTLRAVRYEPDEEDVELPGEFFQRPLEQAAATNECVLGVSFVSADTATFRDKLQ
ncbi:MAG TPA: hypothetical protein VD833_22065 [Vicinamibacterales bacterium]|nr:hypothetical protein [Vicinamibacterales bacterium]